MDNNNHDEAVAAPADDPVVDDEELNNEGEEVDDDGDWIEVEDDEDEEEDEEGRVIHRDVNCDECGASPVKGIRYHSTRIIDYDICEECYTLNHKDLTLANAFVPITENKLVNENDYFEDPDGLSADAYGWNDLVQELESHPRVQNLDCGIHASLEEPQDAIRPETFELVTNQLANSTSLKSVYVLSHYLEGMQETEAPLHNQMMSALARGMAKNKSIITLSMTLDFSLAEAMDAIAELIRTNTSIRYLFLQHNPDRSLISLDDEADDADVEEQEAKMIQDQTTQAGKAVSKLFKALKQTKSLHSFVCEGYTLVGEDCRRNAIEALQTRPSLKRIKSSVDCPELVELMQAKKQHWMKEWNDPKATPKDRYQILEQVLNCKQVEEEDQVAALFHFVRSNPGSLPQLEVKGGEDDNSTTSGRNKRKKIRLE